MEPALEKEKSSKASARTINTERKLKAVPLNFAKISRKEEIYLVLKTTVMAKK